MKPQIIYMKKIVSTVLLFSLMLNTVGCGFNRPLHDMDWRNLNDNERRVYFASILEEPDKPNYHFRILYFSIGGMIGSMGVAFTYTARRSNGPISWATFLSSVGIIWGGMGAVLQADYTKQRKRIAQRELLILDNPGWRGDRVRAIRKGIVDIGYTDQMVTAAWGDPQIVTPNVRIKDALLEEWEYLIKKGIKIYFNLDRKVTAIRTNEVMYFSRSSDREAE